MIAGAACNAAGPPFAMASSLVHDEIGMFTDVFPGYSMAGLALTLLIVILDKKLTARGVTGFLGALFTGGCGSARSLSRARPVDHAGQPIGAQSL
ncbi:hypothetical protein OG612_03940 [Streptomyces sp. NBC_01527]|uniref:hypothetical protein n=1 Tax=unclassified Streptomyces TaxID=2593676 RepID=UPI002E146A65|nr:hypothetical protein OG763_39775 [Streptomyces sp. NBC_01230]